MPVYVENQLRVILSYLPNLIAALLILIVGYIVARIVSGLVRGLLRRTTLDNRLAAALGGTGLGAENAIASAAFWLVMVFVLVGFFQALALAAISEPLNLLLAQFFAQKRSQFAPPKLSAVADKFNRAAEVSKHGVWQRKRNSSSQKGKEKREKRDWEWSGRWESNPHLKLGKLPYYHYTTAA